MSPIIAKSPGLGPFAANAPPFPFDDRRTCLTANGRIAIRIGLAALGLPRGARVLVPAWHCGSEIDAILAAGGRPIPYRLTADLQADPDDIARLLRGGAGAIHVIHYFGVAQPLAPLHALARDAGALLVEDLALGLYSTGADGVPLGRAGDMAVFSLVKTLGLPDGGALWTKAPVTLPRLARPALRATLAALRSVAANDRRRRPRSAPPDQSAADLDRWDPAAGLALDAPPRSAARITRFMLSRIDHAGIASRRRQNYRLLATSLAGTGPVHTLIPDLPEGACPAYFPLWADDPDRVCAALLRAGIEPVRFWRRLHPAIDLGPFPDILALKRHIIRLPIHQGVDAAGIARIARACRTA